jgi:hypothetical protein
MHKYLVLTCFVLHALYLSSPYVLTMMTPKHANEQLMTAIFYAFSYCISLYDFKYIKYFAIFSYAVILYRVVPTFFMTGMYDFPFLLAGSVLAAACSVAIIFNLIRNKGPYELKDRTNKLNVLFYSIFIGFASCTVAWFKGEFNSIYAIMILVFYILSVVNISHNIVNDKAKIGFQVFLIMFIIILFYILKLFQWFYTGEFYNDYVEAVLVSGVVSIALGFQAEKERKKRQSQAEEARSTPI